MVRLMHYDNHSEKWLLKKVNDADVLSVITENPRGMQNLRMSHDLQGKRERPSLKRESLRNALIR